AWERGRRKIPIRFLQSSDLSSLPLPGLRQPDGIEGFSACFVAEQRSHSSHLFGSRSGSVFSGNEASGQAVCRRFWNGSRTDFLAGASELHPISGPHIASGAGRRSDSHCVRTGRGNDGPIPFVGKRATTHFAG